MGTVYRKSVTRPLPNGAEMFTKAGEQFARWKPATGRMRTAKVVTGADGPLRIRTEVATFTAKYRDGAGIVREVSTGCKDEDAARSILRDLERRAELVKSGVMSNAEDSIADQQAVALDDHFGAYLHHLQAKGAGHSHRDNTGRNLRRVAMECGWKSLRDMTRQPLERWLAQRTEAGMSARSRNAHLSSLVSFANWCTDNGRLTLNPLTRIAKANEKADPRRQRRALTEAELNRLILVARWRPLAEHGRESLDDAGEDGRPRKRSNWSKAELTLDGLEGAVSLARLRLAANPELVEKLDRLGRERALIVKTLVLTGLRKGELASMTVGQLVLDGPMPCLMLNAADEKNRQGSTIPLRADLVADLREWLADAPKPLTLRLRDHHAKPDPSRKLFMVPAGLVRILDRDLKTAGIAKRDERGRTIDVHALRTTFGTLLSKGGVAPRTAQAAMRHSSIDLTMNTYTDPKLLDVQGAVDSLPTLTLPTDFPTRHRQTLKATGTEDIGESAVAPTVAPTLGKSGATRSFPVIASKTSDDVSGGWSTGSNSEIPRKKPLSAGFANKGLGIGLTGFEPATSCTPSKCASQAALQPESDFALQLIRDESRGEPEY